MPLLVNALAQADTAASALPPVEGFNYDALEATSAPMMDAATTAAAQAAALVGNAADAVNNVNWATPTRDIFIIIFFVVAVFLYGLSLGRDRVLVVLVSIYMALAVVANAPFLTSLPGNFAVKAGTFLGVFLLLFFLISRTALTRIFGNLAAGRLWQVLLFSVLQVGLLISVTLSFLPAEATAHLHPLTVRVFVSEMGRFTWIAAPIVAMVFFSGERNQRT